MPLFVEMHVMLHRLDAILAGRNNWDRALLHNILAQIIGIIPFIGQKSFV